MATTLKTLKLYTPTKLETGNAICKEYSNQPKQLETILNKLSTQVEIKRPEVSKWNEDKKLLSLPIDVVIEREGKKIEFTWYASHNDAMCYISEEDYYKLTRDKCTRKRFIDRFGDNYNSCFGSAKSFLINKAKKEFLKNLKYSILTSVACGYYISPIFADFCGDFGYDQDSIKAMETWQNCLKHSQKLMSIFNETEIESFPS